MKNSIRKVFLFFYFTFPLYVNFTFPRSIHMIERMEHGRLAPGQVHCGLLISSDWSASSWTLGWRSRGRMISGSFQMLISRWIPCHVRRRTRLKSLEIVPMMTSDAVVRRRFCGGRHSLLIIFFLEPSTELPVEVLLGVQQMREHV